MRLTSRAQSLRKNPSDMSGPPGRKPALRVGLVVRLFRILEISSGCKLGVPVDITENKLFLVGNRVICISLDKFRIK